MSKKSSVDSNNYYLYPEWFEGGNESNQSQPSTSSYSYPTLEYIWSNAVRLTRTTHSNLQDEIEYIEANLGGGNESCNCSALQFGIDSNTTKIENLSTIKLSRDGSQPMEGELTCNSGLKTDIIKARTQSIIDCQNQLRVYQSLGGDGDNGLWLGSDFSTSAPAINLYPYASSANGKIFIKTPRSDGIVVPRIEIPGKEDLIDIKIRESNIVPYDDNYQDLGSNSKRWKNIYALKGNFSGTIIPDSILTLEEKVAHIGPYSAIVYKDNGTIYAKDRGGNIIAQGVADTDDVTVIQNAIDTINSSGGGQVRLANCTFIIDTPIVVQAKVSLIGEDAGTTLVRKAGVDTTMIEFDAKSMWNFQYIGHFKMDGNARNNASGYAILLGKDRRHNPDFVLFENIEIEDTDGIKFEYGCYWNRFVKVNVRNPVNWAVYMGSDYPNLNSFLFCRFTGRGPTKDANGVYIDGRNNDFYGCDFSSCNTAVYIKHYKHTLIGCWFENNNVCIKGSDNARPILLNTFFSPPNVTIFGGNEKPTMIGDSAVYYGGEMTLSPVLLKVDKIYSKNKPFQGLTLGRMYRAFSAAGIHEDQLGVTNAEIVDEASAYGGKAVKLEGYGDALHTADMTDLPYGSYMIQVRLKITDDSVDYFGFIKIWYYESGWHYKYKYIYTHDLPLNEWITISIPFAHNYEHLRIEIIKQAASGTDTAYCDYIKIESTPDVLGYSNDDLTINPNGIVKCGKDLEVDGAIVGDSSDGLNLVAEDSSVASKIQLTPGSDSKILLGTFAGQSVIPRIEIPQGDGNVSITIRGAHLMPYTDNDQNLGNSSNRWKELNVVKGIFSEIEMNSRIWSNNTLTIGHGNSSNDLTQIMFTSTDLSLRTPDSGNALRDRISLTGGVDDSIVYIKNAHLLPYDNLSSYLGSTAHRWIEVFADRGSFAEVEGKDNLKLAGGDPSVGHAQIELHNGSAAPSPGALIFLTTNESGNPIERLKITGDWNIATLYVNKAHLEPYYDNSYRLGSSIYRWSDIYAVNTHWGDLGFVEDKCPKCNEKFKIGDNIVLKVIRFSEEDGGIMTIPIHLECAKLPTKTIRRKHPVKEKYYEWDERQGKVIAKWRTKKQKKKIKKKRLKPGYKINQKTGKIESINRKVIDLSEAVEEVVEEVEEIVYQEKEIRI